MHGGPQVGRVAAPASVPTGARLTFAAILSGRWHSAADCGGQTSSGDSSADDRRDTGIRSTADVFIVVARPPASRTDTHRVTHARRHARTYTYVQTYTRAHTHTSTHARTRARTNARKAIVRARRPSAQPNNHAVSVLYHKEEMQNSSQS